MENNPALAHLLDDFESSDVYAQTSLVRPPVLAKVILHQISDTSTSDASQAEQVLSQLAGAEGQAVILRQDTHWTDTSGTCYVVLLATPFTQGNISRSMTEVIISTPTSTHPSGPSISIDRMAITASLNHKPFLPSLARSTATRSTRQQHAMLNFSADGFLSASCVVDPARERREARREAVRGMDELEEEEEDEGFWDDELDEEGSEEEEEDVGRSVSDSSGSITPRPGSFVDVADHSNGENSDSSVPMNPVPHVQVNGHGAETDKYTEEDTFRGFAYTPFPLRRRPISASTRFFSAKGKARASEDEDAGAWPDGENVAWLSLKGLARAGVFVGDWVSTLKVSWGRVADTWVRCC